jgi:hypothetical protein
VVHTGRADADCGTPNKTGIRQRLNVSSTPGRVTSREARVLRGEALIRFRALGGGEARGLPLLSDPPPLPAVAPGSGFTPAVVSLPLDFLTGQMMGSGEVPITAARAPIDPVRNPLDQRLPDEPGASLVSVRNDAFPDSGQRGRMIVSLISPPKCTTCAIACGAPI